MLKPINDGSAPFHDDPNDIAHHLRDNAIRNIEAGQPFISEVTLPFFEMEAISRIKKQTNICPENEPNRNRERELWRQKWVCEAQFAERNIYNYEPVAQAAMRVLLTSARLRGAIDDNSAPQMIAALSMLLACEVLEGGYVIKFESLQPLAIEGNKFRVGRKPGTQSPLRKLIAKLLKKNPKLKNKELLELVKSKPPKGYTYCENRYGKYFEGKDNKTTEIRRFNNICSEARTAARKTNL